MTVPRQEAAVLGPVIVPRAREVPSQLPARTRVKVVPPDPIELKEPVVPVYLFRLRHRIFRVLFNLVMFVVSLNNRRVPVRLFPARVTKFKPTPVLGPVPIEPDPPNTRLVPVKLLVWNVTTLTPP